MLRNYLKIASRYLAKYRVFTFINIIKNNIELPFQLLQNFYTITLMNRGAMTAQLKSRHWIITDADNKVEEVKGDGVVGEQPIMKPGEGFRYTSGAVIETPVGTMQGSYQMVAEDGCEFDADIPRFVLSIPRVIH